MFKGGNATVFVSDLERAVRFYSETLGPSPFDPRDRSRFLQRLDQIIQAIQRGK